jgi:excinuclease ABC subunit A
VVVDRLIIDEGINMRLSEGVEAALKLSGGLVIAESGDTEYLFSNKYSCPDCDINIDEIQPRSFSFNNPFGACPDCHGLGFKNEIDPEKIFPDKEKPLNESFNFLGWNMDNGAITQMYLHALSKRYNFDVSSKISQLPEEILNIILYGNNIEKIEMQYSTHHFKGSYKKEYEGIIPNLA